MEDPLLETVSVMHGQDQGVPPRIPYGGCYREGVEKARLQSRNSEFLRYGEEIVNPFKSLTEAPCFLNEVERLQTDASSQAWEERHESRRKYEKNIERKRQNELARHDTRWQKMTREFDDQERKLEERRTSEKGRNVSGLGFNILNHSPLATAKGRTMVQQEEATRNRSMLRAKRLHEKRSGATNPITGEALSGF